MLRLGGASDGSARLAAVPVEVRFTGKAEGDLVDATGQDPAVADRRRAIVDRPWTWLRQVHGNRVVTVRQPGDGAGDHADAAVSDHPGAVLAVFVADCAPLALASPEGLFGAVHAGWRGLLAGVVSEAVGAMRAMGATNVRAALGPCIHAECYAFGDAELAQLVRRFGDVARGRERGGGPALDLPAAVRAALAEVGAVLEYDDDRCTACSPDYWSWRARGDEPRQAVAVWRP